MYKRQYWNTARLQCLIDCSFTGQTPMMKLLLRAWFRWAIGVRFVWDGIIIHAAGRPVRIRIRYCRNRTLKREQAAKRVRYVIVAAVNEAPVGCIRIDGEWPPEVAKALARFNGRPSHG